MVWQSRATQEAWQQRQWEEKLGVCGVYRYCKFRARGYQPADEIVQLIIFRILARCFETEGGFVEQMTELLAKYAQKGGSPNPQQTLRKWSAILLEEVEHLAGHHEYQAGEKLVLWHQPGHESIECEIVAQVGRGATATVYEVRYAGLTRALKVFKATRSINQFSKLGEEASLMLHLNHPTSHRNSLAIDFVRYEEEMEQQLFFLLQYVDGGTLEQWIHDGRLYAADTEAEVQALVVRVMYELCSGLAYLHSKGVLHEDIKPENVLMKGRREFDAQPATVSAVVAPPSASGAADDSSLEGGRPVMSDFGVSAKGVRTEVGSGGCAVAAEVKGATHHDAARGLSSDEYHSLFKPARGSLDGREL